MKKVCTKLINSTLIPLLMLSCATQKTEKMPSDDNELLRPNPGYVQYVKNRSLLAQSNAIIESASTSLHALSEQNLPADTLLNMASVWLAINPATYITDIGTSFLKSLDYADILSMLHQTGVQGIYTAPLFGTSYLWTNNSKMIAYNKDAIQLEIATDLGSIEDFARLRTSIGNNSMFFGTSALPTVTGMGPDFWLATHADTDYESLYAIIPLPKTLWEQMPSSSDASFTPLSKKAINMLIHNKVIPPLFAQDTFPYLPKTGWAITPTINDINGEEQRYVYRYYYNPTLPLLHLKNPSLLSKRILNASILQSIGVYGSALVGFSALPYYGLIDAHNINNSHIPYTQTVEHITQTIQQYGAFAFIQDSLPLPLLATILHKNKSVFIEDSISSPYAEYALLTHNTALLKYMITNALNLNIPFEHLVHTTRNEEGLSLQPIALFTTDQQKYITPKVKQLHSNVLETIKNLSTTYPLMIQDTLPYSSPALAAISLQYPIHTKANYTDAQFSMLLKAHKALIFFKAMLPGILMLSTHDFIAPLPLDKKEYERTGETWNPKIAGYGGHTLQVLPYSTLINRFNIPTARTLYPDFQTQDITPISFKKELQPLLELRAKFNIATTSLVEIIPTEDTTIALVLKNSENTYFIAITNFSPTPTTVQLAHSSTALKTKLQQAKIQSYPQVKIQNQKITLPAFGTVLLTLS